MLAQKSGQQCKGSGDYRMPGFQVARWVMDQKLWLLAGCRQPELFLAAPTFQVFKPGKWSQLLTL